MVDGIVRKSKENSGSELRKQNESVGGDLLSKKQGELCAYEGFTLYKHRDFTYKHRLLIHFIVFAIITIFVGKSFFVQTDFFFLYLYGVLVTLVLALNFYIAIFRYEDPAILASKQEGIGLQGGCRQSGHW